MLGVVAGAFGCALGGVFEGVVPGVVGVVAPTPVSVPSVPGEFVVAFGLGVAVVALGVCEVALGL